MFFSYKKQIVWNAAWLLWCVGFIIFDLVVGQFFWAGFMLVLILLFLYVLVGSIGRYRAERRQQRVTASYRRIDNEWRDK